MIRTLIADDHEMFRQALMSILEVQPDMTVVGEARNSFEVMDRLKESKADVLILDLVMPGRGGLETTKDVSSRLPKVKILEVTGHPEDDYAIRCLRAGADGYITKTSSAEELLAAIRRVAGGGKSISPTLAEHLAVSIDRHSEGDPHESLSDRELQVLRKIGAGRSSSEIAEELCLSTKTVSTYRCRILDKLGLESNAQLIRYAIEHDLVE